jgi:hypothetical protein
MDRAWYPVHAPLSSDPYHWYVVAKDADTAQSLYDAAAANGNPDYGAPESFALGLLATLNAAIEPRTAEEVWDLLEAASPGSQYSCFMDHMWSREPEALYVSGLGDVHFVAATGGEGQGDECSVVLRISDRYYVAEGSYSSYNATEWYRDYFYEAKPVTETVTVYRKV